MPAANTIPAIMGRLVLQENGCLLWPEPVATGYGKVGYGGRKHYVHRLLYEVLVGPVPAGKELDHLCRNRACANVCHLEPVSRRENVRRAPPGEYGKGERKVTHCPQGHPYAGDNVRVRRGKRECLTCCRIAQAKIRARKRGDRPPGRVYTQKSHCPQGHPYSGPNLLVRSNGHRECRACIKAANVRQREKRALQKPISPGTAS